MFRKLRRKVVRLVVVSGAGAAASYFFDRERGPERREQAKEKAASLVGRQSPANDWQSSAANSFETPATAAPASAPVDLPQTPSASVSDILDGSGGDSVAAPAPEPGPGPVPQSGPTSTS